MHKNLKKLLLFSVLLGIVLLVAPQPAHASFIDDTLTDVVTGMFKGFAYIINFIGGLLFVIANFFVGIMMKMNLEILNSSTNQLVDVGWKIMRDLANLGFVLVIIIVAISTIVRYQTYGAKRLLPKLIAAAILVNFSLAIAGVFIDFSNVLTTYFLSKATPGGSSDISVILNPDKGLPGQFANAFGPQRFLLGDQNPIPLNPDEETGGLTEFGTAVLTSIAGLVFTIVFTFLSAFTLLVFAFLLLVRYLYLSFLIVIVPIVWLFWVIPALSNQFSKWWSSFFKWVFFAPASSFFIYLALVATQELAKQPGLFTSDIFSFGTIQSIITQGVQMVILCGFMLGGLIIAEKMGIEGARGAMAVGQSFRKGLIGGKGFQKRAQELAEKAGDKSAGGIARIPGLRRAVGIFSSKVGEKQKELEAKRIQEGDKINKKIPLIGGKRFGMRGAEDIAKDIEEGTLPLEEARKRAGSIWRAALPFARRQRNRYIMALAMRESGTKINEETGVIETRGLVKGFAPEKRYTPDLETEKKAHDIVDTFKKTNTPVSMTTEVQGVLRQYGFTTNDFATREPEDILKDLEKRASVGTPHATSALELNDKELKRIMEMKKRINASTKRQEKEKKKKDTKEALETLKKALGEEDEEKKEGEEKKEEKSEEKPKT